LTHKLNLILCDNYLKEAEYVIKKERLTNVEINSYPANCMKCTLSNVNNHKKIINSSQLDQNNTKVIFCSAFENQNKEKMKESDFKLNMCYSILAGETLANSFNKQGFYIVTPGWLTNWKKYVIDLWQFDSFTAKAFFKESAKKILFLDSGLYNDVNIHLKEFSAFISLEYDVLPVGIDYFRNHIMNIYLEWKNQIREREVRSKSKHLAEFSFMLDMIFEMNKLIDIDEIINKMFDLFVMITGASRVAYLRTMDNKPEKIYTYRNIGYKGELLEEDLGKDFSKFKIKESKPRNKEFIVSKEFMEYKRHIFKVLET